MDEQRFLVARNLGGRRGGKRTNETIYGTWPGGGRKGSLRLCYARPLLGDRNVGSQVVGDDRSRLPGIETVGEVRGVR